MRAGCAGEVSTSPGSLSRSTLVDTMWDRVTEKNNDLSRIIDSTRHLLQRYSVTAEL
jgi:DNA-binding winged helix-turn-helix (wHTH) protein